MTNPQLVSAAIGSRRALRCTVTSEDIDAMLDAYDSGMCDVSTRNCLSQAVGRALGTKVPVPLVRHSPKIAYWDFENCRLPVPTELLEWLDAAEIGLRARPIQFELSLPEDCPVSETVASLEVELSLAS